MATSLALATGPACRAAEDDAAQAWAIHGQTTLVVQGHPSFAAPYSGPNSLSPAANGRETVDVTLFAGVRPWRGAEIWLDPEADQGFGLTDTLGVAGFPSAEAYKVGASTPYFRLQRAFLRQTIDLGGATSVVDADLNQLRGRQSDSRLVITIGKFSVVDVFDTNDYAHDAKHDFLNWGVVDALTFDYAADSWGYTYGLATEWYQGAWAVRAGLFDLSIVPNSPQLDPTFQQFQMVGEIERRYALAGRPGFLKVTTFLSRGRMGSFADAIALAAQTGSTPSVASVRLYRGRAGVSIDLQQQVTDSLGVFFRAGLADGAVEPYEFTDVDRAVSGGVALKGKPWGRPADTLGAAAELNAISEVHQQYFDGGGLGLLIGDGRLPHPGDEGIIESYYSVSLAHFIEVGADYQFVNNPAYNRDRGPVSIFAARLHAQF